MSCVTIDADFLKVAGEDKGLFKDVLFVFAQDNPWRICLDKTGLAIQRYDDIISGSEILRLWLSMFNEKKESKCNIEIDPSIDNSGKHLFLNIACKSFDKILLVAEKETFVEDKSFIGANGIQIFLGSEMKDVLSAKNIQITYGDKSPIIVGNDNNCN